MCQKVQHVCYRALAAALLFAAVLAFILSPPASLPFLSRLARSLPLDWIDGSGGIEVAPTGFVVDTPSCRIPDFDAYNPSVAQFIREPSPHFVDCNHSLPITFTDRQYVRLNTTLTKSLDIEYCLYQQV